jgi:thioredoxin reductase (NADPH)
VVTVDLTRRLVHLSDRSTYEGGAIVIATGVRRRKLGVVGEEKFRGRGILTSGIKEAESVTGKRVVIVGGGDAAIENSLILSEYADSVTVVHRRGGFTAREEFVERAKQLSNVKLMMNYVVERFGGRDELESLTLRNVLDNSAIEIACDHCLIRIGVRPNTELFSSQLSIDINGYIKTDPSFRSSVENVYAVGDVANPLALTISTAVGNAATAVSVISKQKTKQLNPKN